MTQTLCSAAKVSMEFGICSCMKKPDLGKAQRAMEQQFSRRLALGASSAIVLAVGANFCGMTSLLLGLNPETARALRLDVLYPVDGFKRCLDRDKGFEFIYPTDWVADQRILYRSIEKAERTRSLDLPPLKQKTGTAARNIVEPIAAFGPPGTNGLTNVSLIIAPINPEFMIDKLGDAKEVGNLILNKYIAPPGSDKTANLLAAQKREQALENQNDRKIIYYTLEYSVKAANFFRHNITVYTVFEGQLYSLNAQVPETSWQDMKSCFLQIAYSFRLLA